MSRKLSDVLWIGGAQIAAALGTLIGVRILTQVLPPGPYGVVSLALGIATLVTTLMAAPLTQAAMHYYPALVAQGSAGTLRVALRRGFLRMAPWVMLAAVVGAVVFVRWDASSPILSAVLLALVASGYWRSVNLSLLNSARLHGRLGFWTAADAWARPLSGAAVVLTIGPSPIAVLAAYAGISALLVLLLSDRPTSEGARAAASLSPEESKALDMRLWSYALPLVPLGIISWASSLGDRYIIGGLLSIADAGVYAALYGLASTPFIILQTTLEQGLRPIHQNAVSGADHLRAASILRLWLGASVVLGGLGVVALIMGHEWLASLLVGPSYRHASDLLPWVGAGYAIRAVSYVFERVCYAYGRTRRVLVTQLCGALTAAAFTPAAVVALGLKGAAIAVPAYFAVQLVTAVFLARRTLRDAAQPSARVAAPSEVPESNAQRRALAHE